MMAIKDCSSVMRGALHQWYQGVQKVVVLEIGELVTSAS